MINLSEAIERMRAFNPVPIAETEAMRGIRSRTAKGMDSAGSDFAPYRPGTIKFRQKRGLRTDRVNLRVKTEGSLLDLLGEQTVGEVGFPAAKAGQVEGLQTGKRKYGTQAPREFLGFNPEDIREMERKIEAEWERILA